MRAAIIGIGAIARLHAKALADIPGVTLVAASCRTEEKGRAFAGEFGCAWHADTATMLRREKPDVVTVATPSGALAVFATDPGQTPNQLVAVPLSCAP